jgi:Cu+-exporting ATPase
MGKVKKVTLQIEGMDCSHCAASISKTIEKRGLQDVNVNFATGEGSFLMPENVSLEHVITDIEKLGYKAAEQEAVPVAPRPGLSTLEKKFLFSLVFTIPLLLPMVVHVELLHNPWVQFAICLPVFTLGTLHFGRSAWGSIRAGMPNMDVLILVGTWSAFYYSLAGTILYDGMAQHYLFYETAATIITLVLLGNVFEYRSVKQTTTAIRDLSALQVAKARRVSAHGDHEHIEEVDTLQLLHGDVLVVNSGDRIPADGVIISGNAEVDESMITGESMPVTRMMGKNVIAGTLVIDGSIRMITERVGKETVLSQIVELVKNAQNQKPAIQRLGDRVSAIFVPAVFAVALLTFLLSFFAFHAAPSQALMQAIAVLVISCPCAMGLATPTAVMVGIGRAARSGILIKGGSTLELLAGVKQVVFDKTGTLTTGQFAIKKIDASAHDLQAAINLLYAAELKSSHPIAKSVVQALRGQTTAGVEFSSVKEIRGSGLELETINGDHYRVGPSRLSADSAHSKYDLIILKNEQFMAGVEIEDELKEGVAATMRWLKSAGIEPVLLSGDSRRKCEEVGEAAGITAIYSEKTPAEKIEVISQLMKKGDTAMVGDGINDGPALARATVGVSISNASQVAIQSAQVILLRASDLKQLEEAIRISRHTLVTIRQNLFWAFFYNVVAIPIAAFGLLSPMVSALSMAFSDVIVIGNSIRLKIKNISR